MVLVCRSIICGSVPALLTEHILCCLLTRIEKQILRLNVSVANPLRVDVGEAPEQLVHVQLDEGRRDRLLALAVLPRNLVHRLWDELQHEVL